MLCEICKWNEGLEKEAKFRITFCDGKTRITGVVCKDHKDDMKRRLKEQKIPFKIRKFLPHEKVVFV